MICNPKDDRSTGSGQGYMTAGRKVVACCGMIIPPKSQAGNRRIRAQLVCLQDLEEGSNEVGRVGWAGFTITEKAMFVIANYASAVDLEDPFDTADDEVVWEVLTEKPLVATFEEEEGSDGKMYVNATPWYTSLVDEFGEDYEDPDNWPEEWDDIVEEAEKKFKTWLANQPNQPKGGKKKKRSTSKRSSPQNDETYDDDEIPF